MTSREILRRNIALIGPPGSGKGTYGDTLSKALDMPLITASNVLREKIPSLDLSSGALVSDENVNDAVYSYARALPRTGYIIDGFPRTLHQMKVMKDTWEYSHQIHGAVLLDVPNEICSAKTLGRRVCTLCGGNFNTAAVYRDGFELPAKLPDKQQCLEECDPKLYWQTRDDDVKEVIEKRLQTYHQHADPILSLFESRNPQALLRFVPYKGFEDVKRMISTVRKWKDKFDHE